MTILESNEPAVTEVDQTRNSKLKKIAFIAVANVAVVTYFIFATLKYINSSKINCLYQFALITINHQMIDYRR